MEEENYKMECYISGDILYLNSPFEVWFDNEHSMRDLQHSLPDSYTHTCYQKTNNGQWLKMDTLQ